MTITVNTPSGPQGVIARICVDPSGAPHSVKAVFKGTPTGTVQVFPSFTVSVAQTSGGNLGSVQVGSTVTAGLTATINNGGVAPFTYSWSASVSGSSVAVGFASSSANPVTVQETGESPGTSAVTISVTVTDSTGAQAIGTFPYNATATSAPAPPKFTSHVAGPTSQGMSVGQTINLGYSATAVNGSGSPASPVTFNWYVSGGGAITPSIIGGQGTPNITLQLHANYATTGEGIAVNCIITDATNYAADSGNTSTGVYLATAAS